MCQALPDCIFALTDPSDIEQIAKFVTPQQTRARSAVYSAGDSANGIFVLCRGTVKLVEITSTGQQRLVSFVSPGQVFGLEGLEEGRSRVLTAIARQDALSLHIADSDFASILSRSTALFWRFACMLFRLLENAHQRQVATSGRRVRHRIVNTLLGCDAEFNMNQTELAELLGVPAETISREIAPLRAAGVLEIKDGAIVATPRLRRIAHQL